MAGIKLKNIQKSYQVEDRNVPVLNGIDLDIPQGQITVILGQSGCGKTTLLRLTGGLETADSGEIRWESAHKTAFVFQEPRLMPWLTVWENVVFGLSKKETDPAKIEAVIRTVGLSGFEKAYPAQLSGGMQQRVGIAAAMLLSPGVLLADEPTSALDVTLQKQVVEEMRMVRDTFGTAIVLVAHNLGVIGAMADNVLVLKDGKAVEYGKTGDILTNPQADYTKALLAAVPRLRR